MLSRSGWTSRSRDLPEQERARLLAEEKQRAQDLQRQGIWRHLWRVAGRYSNISIFDVDSNDSLHPSAIEAG